MSKQPFARRNRIPQLITNAAQVAPKQRSDRRRCDDEKYSCWASPTPLHWNRKQKEGASEVIAPYAG
jgi:hypothetical protein